VKITVSGARAQKHFQYGWEKKTNQNSIQRAMSEADAAFPTKWTDKRMIAGLFVYDFNGEGAVWFNQNFDSEFLTPISMADALLDAIGDMDALRLNLLGFRDG
jgi:hypothetical protein